MLRILVLGHSDSSGAMLADPAAAWPSLLAAGLQREEFEVDVRHVLLEPLRAETPARLRDTLQEFAPDLVLLHLSPYAFAIGTGALRVRQRFGQRAGHGFSRLERRFSRWSTSGRLPRTANVVARRLARRIIGTASIATYDQVVSAYDAALRELARSETRQTIVMGGSRLASRLRAENPAGLALIIRFGEEMQRLARLHHFAWFDTEATVAGPGRDSLFLADAVHRNAEGYARLADLLLPVVEEHAHALTH